MDAVYFSLLSFLLRTNLCNPGMLEDIESDCCRNTLQTQTTHKYCCHYNIGTVKTTVGIKVLKRSKYIDLEN